MSVETAELITSLTIISFVVLGITGVLIFMLIRYKVNREKYLQEKLNMKNTFNQELLKTRLEIQEETFKTISQEIHDNIGQALSFVKLNINTIDVYNPEKTKEKLQESKMQLSQTIQDLRDIAKSLSPDFIAETGLPGAIQHQLLLLQKSGGYKTSMVVGGQPFKYEQQQELVLFRIVQELLNNIVKHAEATEVEVIMQYGEAKLAIYVKDNGKGFDIINHKGAGKGLGLQNMRNRMLLLNGIITFERGSTNGTVAILELPGVFVASR